MARAAVIPGVAAITTSDQPATRSTRGRGRSAQIETTSKTDQQQPAKRGRKPGKTAATTTTTQKKKQTEVEEEESTDDEIGLDVVAKPNNKPTPVAASTRVRGGGRQARSASVQSEQEQHSDEDEVEEEDEDDDDELAQLGVMTKKTARSKAKTTTSTTTSSNKTKAEPAARSTRGRPKTVKDSQPAATTTTTRKPRGRPPTKQDAEKKIYVATNSSFAKSRPVGETAVRKKVTFADLADSEDEESEKEKQPAKTTTTAASKKQAKPAAGLKAKPVRKTAGTTAGRGRPAKAQQPAAKPLSPKKATQLAKISSSASSGEEDELASEKNIYSLVVRSPTKNQGQPQPQHTGLSSPVKRINFTGSTPTPSRPSSRMENDENSVPGVQPASALRDPAAFLGSPARRPPPSASKETIKDTPRRGPLFASQLAAPNISAHAEASTPTRLSPLKISPKKGANLGASFLASPEKGLSTPFDAKLSLLKSPAKRIQSPFVFHKVTTASSNADEDVDMDGHASKKSSRHVDDDSSDDELGFEIKPARSAEASDDVFVDQPTQFVDEQQDMHVADDNEQQVEENAYHGIQDNGEKKENAESEVSEEAVDIEESTEPQLHDNEVDENMQEEDLAMDVGQDTEISDENLPAENDQVDYNVEHIQDDDHMEEDEDDAAPQPDNDQSKDEEEVEAVVEGTEVHPETSETHEPSSSELEPAIDTLSIQPQEQDNVPSDNTEHVVMQGEYEEQDKTEAISEIPAPVSPAVSLAMSTRSIRHVQPDEIDEPQSAIKMATTFVPPSAPTPPTNPARMHSLMFSYRDAQDDASSVYDPSPLKRRSRVSTRESILPQTPSASASADLPFSPLAAQLSQWKASSPEKTQTNRPQRSIFYPVIPSQLKMKPKSPTKNRYSQIQTMRHSLAARHSLANSISMDDNETDTVERQSDQNEESSEQAVDPIPDTQAESEQSKSSPNKPAESRPSMSITPVRVIRDANRTIHIVSKVPLKPEGDISPIKFPRKRARAMSFDMELPIRASPNRPKLVPKSRMHLSPSPRKQRVPLGEIDPHCLEEPRPDLSTATASPVKTPRANSKAEEQVLRGAVVFVDVHTTEGEDASGIFVELLTQMGAKCVKSWAWNGCSSQSPVDGLEPVARKVGITHVVYKDGGVRTMEKVRQARNLVKCVGVGWVLE